MPVQEILDKNLARIEELERMVQYLVDCPFEVNEFETRRKFANNVLDCKPGESISDMGLILTKSIPSEGDFIAVFSNGSYFSASECRVKTVDGKSVFERECFDDFIEVDKEQFNESVFVVRVN